MSGKVESNKKNKTNKAWIHEHVNDAYVQRARAEGWRSRAAFKLLEIDTTDKLLKPGMTVVDLGSAPGSWSQVAAKRVAPGGRLVALDLLPMEPIEGVAFIQGDFRDESVVAVLTDALAGRRADVVLSDMAPNLSGISASDAARVSHLVELALAFAAEHLQPQGALVAKVFHGSGYSQLVEAFKRQFRVVKAVKPKASRDKSSETFLVGRGRKAG